MIAEENVYLCLDMISHKDWALHLDANDVLDYIERCCQHVHGNSSPEIPYITLHVRASILSELESYKGLYTNGILRPINVPSSHTFMDRVTARPIGPSLFLMSMMGKRLRSPIMELVLSTIQTSAIVRGIYQHNVDIDSSEFKALLPDVTSTVSRPPKTLCDIGLQWAGLSYSDEWCKDAALRVMTILDVDCDAIIRASKERYDWKIRLQELLLEVYQHRYIPLDRLNDIGLEELRTRLFGE
jgi:hypothetical protein